MIWRYLTKLTSSMGMPNGIVLFFHFLNNFYFILDCGQLSLSRVRLFATRWTIAYQAPPSRGFSRQEYCSGLPFPSPGDLPNSWISHIPGRRFNLWVTREAHLLSGFKSWKMMLWKCCSLHASKFGKLSSGHRTGKGPFSFQSQRKAIPKNAQITAQLHSSHTLVK